MRRTDRSGDVLTKLENLILDDRTDLPHEQTKIQVPGVKQVTCKRRKAQISDLAVRLNDQMVDRDPPFSSSATIDVHTVNTS